MASSTNIYIDFDAADFSSSHDQDSHPDEVMLPISEHSGAPQQNVNSFTKNLDKIKAQTMQAPPRPNNALQTSVGANKSGLAPQPQTPKGGLSKSFSNAGSNIQTRTAHETAETVHVKREPQKFFAVRIGRVPGIYDTWAEGNQQTNGFPNAECKFVL